jgi:hypothetical protein
MIDKRGRSMSMLRTSPPGHGTARPGPPGPAGTVPQQPHGDRIEDCTVPYDDRSGCGVNVARAGRPASPFVAITFMTISGAGEPHDLTVQQAQQLRAALDAAIRTDPVTAADHRPDEPLFRVAGAS